MTIHEYFTNTRIRMGARSIIRGWNSWTVSLREIGLQPAESTSRNPLESPWLLEREVFQRRVGWDAILLHTYEAAREETSALTQAIVQVEAEIDARVRALYGL